MSATVKALCILFIVLFSSCLSKTGNKHWGGVDSVRNEFPLDSLNNVKLDSVFNFFFSNKTVITDSLSNYQSALKEKLRGLVEREVYYSWKETTFYENDDYQIRSHKLIIDDSINIEFFSKITLNIPDDISDDVILVNGVVLREKKLFGEMYELGSDIYFDYSLIKGYKTKKDENLILLVGLPGRWCGLATQYDFYQLIDLNESENIQFAEKGDWILELMDSEVQAKF